MNAIAAGSTHGLGNRRALQHVQAQVNSYLRQEQEAMEERVRVFVEQQYSSFEAMKSQVKSQKALVTR